jgi:hypothetical protein
MTAGIERIIPAPGLQNTKKHRRSGMLWGRNEKAPDGTGAIKNLVRQVFDSNCAK